MTKRKQTTSVVAFFLLFCEVLRFLGTNIITSISCDSMGRVETGTRLYVTLTPPEGWNDLKTTRITSFLSTLKEERKNIDVEERERERARAGIEPAAAAPSQPECPGVSRSDPSAGSKESASWRASELGSHWHGRLGVGRREKEGKETSGRGSQDKPAQDKEENGSWTNSAKR